MNKKKKCLIVDDELFFLKYLKTLFELNNFEVFSSVNASEALEILKKEKVDFIITDIMMPEKDGFWLMEEIRKNSALRDIPVVVVSNNDNHDIVQKVMQLNAAGYIRKPFLKQHIKKVSEFIKS